MTTHRNVYGYPVAAPPAQTLISVPAEIPLPALAEALANLGLMIDPRLVRGTIRTRRASEAAAPEGTDAWLERAR